eukprot:scaffold8203_cov57-Attheya_sp.AAC.5
MLVLFVDDVPWESVHRSDLVLFARPDFEIGGKTCDQGDYMLTPSVNEMSDYLGERPSICGMGNCHATVMTYFSDEQSIDPHCRHKITETTHNR